MGGGRLRESRSGDILALQIVIVVVEPGDVQVQGWSQKPTIAEFVTIELFRCEGAFGIEAREKRNPVGSVATVA